MTGTILSFDFFEGKPMMMSRISIYIFLHTRKKKIIKFYDFQ